MKDIEMINWWAKITVSEVVAMRNWLQDLFPHHYDVMSVEEKIGIIYFNFHKSIK